MGIDGQKFEELIEVMAALRGPNGCPWDREQTHASLSTSFLEELYEFIEAAEDNNVVHMREELGDLCLHIVFQAQIAREAGEFTIAESLDNIIVKLRRRHPHVFGDVKVEHTDEVLDNWDRIKREEKKHERSSVVDGIPRHLPALQKAHTLQRKVQRVGFDWQHVQDVIAKVDEELREVGHAIEQGKEPEIEEELGDLLFSVVNLARFVKVDPEQALHRTVRKFMQRFREIEDRLAAQGKSVHEATFEELDGLWEAIKAERQET
jgi:tetrapyrrole methylase family protein/MazG family protein